MSLNATFVASFARQHIMDRKIETKDSNGNILVEGDAVLLTKDLKVKGFHKDLKRGTLIKNILLTDSPDEIEGRVEGSVLVIKTMYLKKK
jgi:protein PhnA